MAKKLKSSKDFAKEAANQYASQYASALTAATNTKNAAKATRDATVGSINSSYDSVIDDLKKEYQANATTYDNNMLSRGIGRSSVATSGLAGLKDAETGKRVKVNAERSDKITAQDTTLANANTAADAGVRDMEKNKSALISALQNTLYQNYLNTELTKANINALGKRGGGGGGVRNTNGGSEIDESGINSAINGYVSASRNARSLQDMEGVRNRLKTYKNYLKGYLKNNPGDKRAKSYYNKVSKYV